MKDSKELDIFDKEWWDEYLRDYHRTKIPQERAKVRKMAPIVNIIFDKKCAVCGWYVGKYRKKPIELPKSCVNGARGCDIHHITPLIEGGKSEYDNMVLLCPNHHKEAHLGIIDRETLETLTRRAIKRALKNGTVRKAVDPKEVRA